VQVGLSDRVSIGAGTPLAVPQTDFRGQVPGDFCLPDSADPVLVSSQRAL